MKKKNYFMFIHSFKKNFILKTNNLQFVEIFGLLCIIILRSLIVYEKYILQNSLTTLVFLC